MLHRLTEPNGSLCGRHHQSKVRGLPLGCFLDPQLFRRLFLQWSALVSFHMAHYVCHQLIICCSSRNIWFRGLLLSRLSGEHGLPESPPPPKKKKPMQTWHKANVVPCTCIGECGSMISMIASPWYMHVVDLTQFLWLGCTESRGQSVVVARNTAAPLGGRIIMFDQHLQAWVGVFKRGTTYKHSTRDLSHQTYENSTSHAHKVRNP